MRQNKNLLPQHAPVWEKSLQELTKILKRNDRRIDLIQEMDIRIQRAADNFDSVFEFILTKGLKEVNADYGHILIKAGDFLKIRYSNCKEDSRKMVPIKGSLCGSAFTEGETFIIDDVISGKEEKKYYLLHNETKSEVAMPIQDSGRVKTFGILNIEWKVKDELNDENINFCKLLNGKIAIAMEQMKHWQGVRLISELGSLLLIHAKGPEKAYGIILDKILKILDFDLGQILLVNGKELVIVASSKKSDINEMVNKNSVCGDYIFIQKAKKPLKIKDVQTDPYYKDKYQPFLGNRKEGIHSEFVVPLVGENNNIIGVINIEDPRIDVFSEFDEHIISIFGKMIARAIDASNERKINNDMENAKELDIIYATQSHLLVNFLHTFGNKITRSKARIADFKRSISSINDTLPTFSKYSSAEFLEEILKDMRYAHDLLEFFKSKMDLSTTETKRVKLNLFSSIYEAIDRAKSKANDSILIMDLVKDKSIVKRKSITVELTKEFDSVLDCLLNNAIEAMPNGGEISIKISLSGLSACEVSVSDTGTGMDKHTIDKIFDLGFTTKRDNSARLGEGLGLWYVRYYLQRFKASIAVNSEFNSGTVFFLTIPTKS